MEIVLYKRHPKYQHIFCGSNGEIWNLKTSRFLTGHPSHDGYLRTYIFGRNRSTHRTIMQCFHGFSELSVDHINGVKTDNNINNLRYLPISDNIKESYKRNPHRERKITKTKRKSAWSHGELNIRSKLKEDNIIEIFNMRKSGTSVLEISIFFKFISELKIFILSFNS